jgi:hypothetical protein
MIKLAVALAVAIALGLLSRLAHIGWPPYDKSLGDVMYAVAAYLALAMLLRRRSRALVAGLTLTLCLAIEFFQATGIPERYGDWLIVRWLIGTDFAWHDIGCYVLGVAVVWPLDVWLRRPAGLKEGDRGSVDSNS